MSVLLTVVFIIVGFYLLCTIPFRLKQAEMNNSFEQSSVAFDKQKLKEDEQERLAEELALSEEQPQLLEIKDYIVNTNSDAERVHNIEILTVRFGKHKGAKWADVPSQYLQWMLVEDHKYVQLARIVLAARESKYNFA
ncbi:DUF3820 family protein [Vibrio sp. 10N.261.46.E12]|uniref:DUF3820 family protein n=1 Tax=unclassified Vibrio TaxID=2614977 RepID=UPI0009780AA1|nr:MULTISPECIES: DUF3820 family protein [unclassified Vibrio]OMO36217.1 hypothetical protein BH584_05420 [Vibrio sp. 10N.261.45.E1]PMJ34431.1 hypothetical protein BCU27_03115 [Vibrio sp. 10N.286.45.B6]PML86802.1 hypothetical protein BCT66_00820 [Vibrio sp. 10N.261.49.E11]PMM76802.1 hypothetical protein BCT48_24695 [Vibrio sp. 10N.261.46.F12]PMM81830.1 hypothetical protein BCT46_15600 [Vibrio sp. 10N.261.46.E8]